jgi:hypothetical protein
MMATKEDYPVRSIRGGEGVPHLRENILLRDDPALVVLEPNNIEREIVQPISCHSTNQTHTVRHSLQGPVYSAYNPSFAVCFFSRNSIFLSQQISHQSFSAGLSAQPNGSKIIAMKASIKMVEVKGE